MFIGQQYTIEVSTDAPNLFMKKIAAWIDYNNDGTFSFADEQIFFIEGPSAATGSYTFTIPATATPGVKRMHVRLSVGQNSYYGPCEMSMNGDTEDYLVVLQTSSAPGCVDQIVNLGSTTAFCEGSSLTLDAGNPGKTFSWNTGATTQTISVTQAGTYTVTVTDGACSTTESIIVTTKTTPTADGIQIIGTDLCSYDFSVNNGANINSYSWNFGDGSAPVTTLTTLHNYTTKAQFDISTIESGIYQLIVETEAGIVVKKVEIKQSVFGISAYTDIVNS